MRTTAVFFPFDLFGSGGTRHGAELLADAFDEMLADNRRETVPTRAQAYTKRVRREEVLFETPDHHADWRARGRAALTPILERGDFLLWVAGNHLGALPLYDALAADPAGTVIVQFDAHLDVYDLGDCTKELSHGNFLLHCAGPLPTLVNIGHRELLLRPDHVARTYTHAFGAAELAVDPHPALETVRTLCGEARRVVFDLDCDVFDASYFPGIAQSRPCGLSPLDFLRFLEAAWTPRAAALAISEYDPARDIRDQSLATLIWLIEYVLLKVHEPRQSPAGERPSGKKGKPGGPHSAPRTTDGTASGK